MVTACSLSERSFTSGGLMNLFLKEASPLAAFRRKRTCFEKSTSFGFLPKEGRPSASFGKLHLWRGGGFLKEARLSELVLKKARPSDSSRRKGVLRLPSASFGKLHLWRGGGFLKEARRPPEGRASFGVLPKEGRPSASSRRKGVLPKEGRPSASFGVLRKASPLAGWRFLRKASPLAGWRLSEGSARGSRRKQLFSERPSGSLTSGGLLPKEGRPSASSRRKGVLRFLRLPSESFTSGGVAAFRRKRTSFGKLHLWRLSEGSRRKRTCFRPSASSRRKGVLRLPPEGRASFASFGFLRKASPLAGWRLPSGSFTSDGFLRKDARSSP